MQVDPFEPDTKRFPEFAKAVVYEANVTAGEIIFIPEIWPHAVRNLESVTAVSYNLVDDFSFEKHEEWNHARLFDDDRDETAYEEKLTAARTHIAHWHPEFPTITTEQISDTHEDETWRQFTQRNLLNLRDDYNETAYKRVEGDFVIVEEAGSAADRQALKIILDAAAAKDALEVEENDAAAAKDDVTDPAEAAEEEVSDSKLLHFIYRWLDMSQSELLGIYRLANREDFKASADHVKTSKHDEL